MICPRPAGSSLRYPSSFGAGRARRSEPSVSCREPTKQERLRSIERSVEREPISHRRRLDRTAMSTQAVASEGTIMDRLAAIRIIPVLSVDDPDQAEACCQALVAGGLPCVEIAFRTEAAAEAIRRAAAIEGLIVGAGTVLTVEQARAALDAGAGFAVAPGSDESVIAVCAQLGLPFFPGVATPTEIGRARALGLTTLKLFPASCVGGVTFLKAVASIFRDVKFIPTGGVDIGCLGEYLALPNVLACGGSWLVKESLLRAGRFDEIERLAREASEVVRAGA